MQRKDGRRRSILGLGVGQRHEWASSKEMKNAEVNCSRCATGGGVLLALPSFQLLSRLLSAACPLFPVPVTGWNRDGRPKNLLLPESAVPRLRPPWLGQPPRLLPQWPPKG